jgi:ATP-dependent DNA helicase PIF1
MAEYMNSIGKTFQVCALTGCAATLLNCKAKTIHSWSGVKLAKGNPEDIIRRVTRNRVCVKSWRGVEVLIVDEVSMMSSKMFEVLDQIGRLARKNGSKPFGGIQLIFTGDFFQLPPIPDYDDPTSGEFCFQNPKWEKIFKPDHCVELKTFFRQTDPTYISILQEVRRGTISPKNIEVLQTRLKRGGCSVESRNGVVPTKIFPVRVKVDTINETSYAKLEGDERVYNYSFTTSAKIHIDTGASLSASEFAYCEGFTSEQLLSEVDNLISSFMADKTVKLKIGSLVMCSANIDVDRGICNGSQGVVIGYAESSTAILPDELMRRPTGIALIPVVRFANGVTMKIAPHQRQSEEIPCVIVAQIPLCLAWALTIHKIQGATLDMAEMDIGRSIFAHGQSYVALSRVKTLDGLYLSEFISTKIKANPLVIEFYNLFKQIGEDEMKTEIVRILSNPISSHIATSRGSGSKDTPCNAIEQKQTHMETFTTHGNIAKSNIFNSFKHVETSELREEEPVAKDPTVKTIKLSKY